MSNTNGISTLFQIELKMFRSYKLSEQLKIQMILLINNKLLLKVVNNCCVCLTGS